MVVQYLREVHTREEERVPQPEVSGTESSVSENEIWVMIEEVVRV
jgi:hypothetical protein